MATEQEDDKPAANQRDLHIMSSNSTSAGSQEGFTSWFRRHGGKSRLGSQDISMRERGAEQEGERVYRVYKRRWFGLVQLTLMNIVVSWDVSILSYLNPLEGRKKANEISGSHLPPSPAKPPSTTPSRNQPSTGSAPPSSSPSSSSSPSPSSYCTAACASPSP